MYRKEPKATIAEDFKLFIDILKMNLLSLVKRERPAFKKQHSNAYERQICRENGLGARDYYNE